MTEEKRQYKRRAKWSVNFHKCRMCKRDTVEHYGGGYCIDCYPKSKEAVILRYYLDGYNLAEIGTELSLSRERVRQLFRKSIEIELSRLGDDVNKIQIEEIQNTIELTNKEAQAMRKYKHYIDNNYDEIINRISTGRVLGTASMLKAIGTPASSIFMIEEEYPEFIELVKANKNRWSWKYIKCKMCSSTDYKHKRWGYCEKCYTKSVEWKEQTYKYRSAHSEQFKEQQKNYLNEYNQRPEVKLRKAQKRCLERNDGKN